MELKTGYRCPTCETGTLHIKEGNLPFNYKGVTATIPMQYFRCDNCKEDKDGVFIPPEIDEKLNKFLSKVRRSIDKDLEFK